MTIPLVPKVLSAEPSELRRIIAKLGLGGTWADPPTRIFPLANIVTSLAPSRNEPGIWVITLP
ncbi:MAG: hypothetical protein OXB92_17075, partial [Acidimicrobiaceae bacterium]|nr:hypothetical protein [Acidimicrobiaceae bacterium]